MPRMRGSCIAAIKSLGHFANESADMHVCSVQKVEKEDKVF